MKLHGEVKTGRSSWWDGLARWARGDGPSANMHFMGLDSSTRPDLCVGISGYDTYSPEAARRWAEDLNAKAPGLRDSEGHGPEGDRWNLDPHGLLASRGHKETVTLSAEQMKRLRDGEASVNTVRREVNGWPAVKLDVRTVDMVGGMGLALFDRETSQVLPGQRSGRMDYSANDFPTLSVEFFVDGEDVKLGDNSKAFAAQHDAAIARDEAAMEERHAANDLQAALRAFGDLTPANRARFGQATGLVERLARDAIVAAFKDADDLQGLRDLRDRILAVKPDRRDVYSLRKLVATWKAEAKRLQDVEMFGEV